MLLLLFHLAEHGILLDLDEVAALVLCEGEPEVTDALALLCRGCAPYLVVRLRFWLVVGGRVVVCDGCL